MLSSNYEGKGYSKSFEKQNDDCLTTTRISTYKNNSLIILSTFLKKESDIKLKCYDC